jgi:hypothetical protein
MEEGAPSHVLHESGKLLLLVLQRSSVGIQLPHLRFGQLHADLLHDLEPGTAQNAHSHSSASISEKRTRRAAISVNKRFILSLRRPDKPITDCSPFGQDARNNGVRVTFRHAFGLHPRKSALHSETVVRICNLPD